eukprot:g50021.t1
MCVLVFSTSTPLGKEEVIRLIWNVKANNSITGSKITYWSSLRKVGCFQFGEYLVVIKAVDNHSKLQVNMSKKLRIKTKNEVYNSEHRERKDKKKPGPRDNYKPQQRQRPHFEVVHGQKYLVVIYAKMDAPVSSLTVHEEVCKVWPVRKRTATTSRAPAATPITHWEAGEYSSDLERAGGQIAIHHIISSSSVSASSLSTGGYGAARVNMEPRLDSPAKAQMEPSLEPVSATAQMESCVDIPANLKAHVELRVVSAAGMAEASSGCTQSDFLIDQPDSNEVGRSLASTCGDPIPPQLTFESQLEDEEAGPAPPSEALQLLIFSVDGVFFRYDDIWFSNSDLEDSQNMLSPARKRQKRE